MIALAHAASASARSARAKGSAPVSGRWSCHFSASLMWVWIQVSGSLISSSEWWWMARKSAVATFLPAARACMQMSKS